MAITQSPSHVGITIAREVGRSGSTIPQTSRLLYSAPIIDIDETLEPADVATAADRKGKTPIFTIDGKYVAKAVAALCGDFTYATGSVVHVDGGLTLQRL